MKRKIRIYTLSIIVVLFIHTTSCEKDKKCLPDPCDIVTYNSNGISIEIISCMGKEIDSDSDLDGAGRIKRWEITFENVTVLIKNVQYTANGEALSFDAVSTSNSQSIERTFNMEYNDDGRLLDRSCN